MWWWTFTRSIKPANLTRPAGSRVRGQWLWTAIFALLAAVAAPCRVMAQSGVMVLVSASGLMPPALAEGVSSSGGGRDLAATADPCIVAAAGAWAGIFFAVLAYALAPGTRWRISRSADSRGSRSGAYRRGLRVIKVTRVPIGDLLDTTYGRLILWKVAAFAVLGRSVPGIGAGRSRRTRTSADDRADARRGGSRCSSGSAWSNSWCSPATFGLAAGLSRTPPPVDTASISPVELQDQLPDHRNRRALRDSCSTGVST